MFSWEVLQCEKPTDKHFSLSLGQTPPTAVSKSTMKTNEIRKRPTQMSTNFAISFSAAATSAYSLHVLPCSCTGQNDPRMSTCPALHHSSAARSLPGSTGRPHIAGNSSNPTCTRCIYPQRTQGGRSNSPYVRHTENLGLQPGCSRRAKKERNKEKMQ